MYAFQNQKRLIDDYMIKFVIEHRNAWNHNDVKIIAAWVQAAALWGWLMTENQSI